VVCEGSVDNVIGILQAKDVLDQMLDGEPLSVDRVLRKAVIMPDTVTALDALEQLKADPLGLAVVLDEYGSFEGVVTSADVLEAIVGELSEGNATPDDCVVRPDGSLLMDGMMPVDEVKTRLGLESVPAEGSYHTLAGLILALLRRLPRTGDRIVHAGWRFEVVDMDGRRVDKVLATREETTDVAEAA
jgi:putative hemolysin